MTNPDSISELTLALREFAHQRDWQQFHDPKSLVLALVGEVGELAELFQWVPADSAVAEFDDEHLKARAGEEIADIATYLLRLADVLSIDTGLAIESKLANSRARFAPHSVRGIAPRKD